MPLEAWDFGPYGADLIDGRITLDDDNVISNMDMVEMEVPQMSTSLQSEVRTRQFARVLGPYLVVVTATALVRASDMRTLLSEFDENSLWAWVTGAFVLLSGLVVIGLHQQWRGVAAIIVSGLGWLTALKGFFLLAFPQPYISVADSMIDAGRWWWQPVMVLMGLVGLFLTYVGWAPKREQEAGQARSASPRLPHAA